VYKISKKGKFCACQNCEVSWPRADGEEYYTLIDEFMAAVKLRWPRALIQFEDFQSKHAIATLKRYRKEYLMFNDDIQVK
jgi:malic enzyme